ncbi:hypothetical protein CTAYLR_007479 [Chrysophaeum taylorii]|uniref:Kinesin-like protein n=1 Tax=Chrysophaeum taylorii TaxID=2483200 RepID=A0AAD7UBD4_9STRA|nr:hypothetical protein CTAYLR_007479 [Chrysophaeum taylorii]
MAEEHKLKVVVRVRPLMGQESEARLEVEEGRVQVGKLGFEFGKENILRGEGLHNELYQLTTAPLIAHLFEGYNATVLAYGQTGSGKTYSMGTSESKDGVVPRAVDEIFERKAANATVFFSLVEVYNEEVRDLIAPRSLAVRDAAEGVVIAGLCERRVETRDEVLELLRTGMRVRATGATDMNARSSRSHMISTFRIEVQRSNSRTVAKLHLVDLAGSERAKRTGATGDRLKEGIGINKSLLALGQVIARLVEIQQHQDSTGHVPYRDSTLTRVLADSLGGSAIAVMIACVSPAADDVEESANTLRWASRALKIRNVAVTNVIVDDSVALRTMVRRLERENELLRKRVRALRCALTPEEAAVVEGAVDDEEAADALPAAEAEAEDDDDDDDDMSSTSLEEEEEEAARVRELESLEQEQRCMTKLREHYERAIERLEKEVKELEQAHQSTENSERKAAKLRAQVLKATREAQRCAELKSRAETEANRLRQDLETARRRRGELQRELQSKDAQHATAARQWHREARRLRRDRDRLSGEKKRLAENYDRAERTRLRQLAESRAALRRLKKDDCFERPLIEGLAREAAKSRAEATYLRERLAELSVDQRRADTIRKSSPKPEEDHHDKVIDDYAARCQRIRRQSTTSMDVDDLAAKMKAVKTVIADVRTQREAARQQLDQPVLDPRLLRDVVPRNYSKPWQHNAQLVVALPPPPPREPAKSREPLAEIDTPP